MLIFHWFEVCFLNFMFLSGAFSIDFFEHFKGNNCASVDPRSSAQLKSVCGSEHVSSLFVCSWFGLYRNNEKTMIFRSLFCVTVLVALVIFISKKNRHMKSWLSRIAPESFEGVG